MWVSFDLLTQNIGMSWQYALILILVIGGLIFYAKSFMLGTMIAMFTHFMLFILFYANRVEWGDKYWTTCLIIAFINLILLSFTLYASSRVAEQGGLI